MEESHINPSTQFTQLGTRAWWARVLCEVPEPTKLGYQARPPSTAWTVWPTKLLIYFFFIYDSGLCSIVSF